MKKVHGLSGTPRKDLGRMGLAVRGGALLFALFLAFSACDLGGDYEAGPGLDPRLPGTWKFEGPNGTDQFVITATVNKSGYFGTMEWGGDWGEGYTEHFAGDIAYAVSFTKSAGALIVEYFPGHEQQWLYWSGEQPTGKFFGVYYVRLSHDGGQVLLAATSDQANNYGPTETATLEQAKARFTEANMPDYIDLSVGDPQTKQP
jgi:hypothetical protein